MAELSTKLVIIDVQQGPQYTSKYSSTGEQLTFKIH